MLKNLTVKFFGLEKLRNIILRFFKAGEHKSKEQKVLGFQGAECSRLWEDKVQKINMLKVAKPQKKLMLFFIICVVFYNNLCIVYFLCSCICTELNFLGVSKKQAFKITLWH